MCTTITTTSLFTFTHRMVCKWSTFQHTLFMSPVVRMHASHAGRRRFDAYGDMFRHSGIFLSKSFFSPEGRISDVLFFKVMAVFPLSSPSFVYFDHSSSPSDSVILSQTINKNSFFGTFLRHSSYFTIFLWLSLDCFRSS